MWNLYLISRMMCMPVTGKNTLMRVSVMIGVNLSLSMHGIWRMLRIRFSRRRFRLSKGADGECECLHQLPGTRSCSEEWRCLRDMRAAVESEIMVTAACAAARKN